MHGNANIKYTLKPVKMATLLGRLLITDENTFMEQGKSYDIIHVRY
jgi:hypothetical protein